MEERLNFGEISALVVDGDRFSSGIVNQILRGFGFKRYLVVEDGETAQKHLANGGYDLLITECQLNDMSGADLIRWVRHNSKDTVRHITVLLLTGYTHYSHVIEARDSGVNSVVRKPVAPNVLFDHISWSAKTERPFIEADEYYGPCRRFRYGEPSPGLNRRASDHYSDPIPRRPDEASKNEEAAS